MNFAGDIPLGTSMTVRTFASEKKIALPDIMAFDEADWQTGQTNAEDCLIFSPPGRYLWLRIELRGNGMDTPILRSIKAHFPRITYLQYLPAVYQSDPVGKDFLERFLSLFETILGGIEHRIDTLDELFDPDGAPVGPGHDFLAWLAQWVDMSFEAAWPVETRRSLLRHAPELYRKRGTPAGLKLFLRLALGVDARILESFQLRRWLFLAARSALGGRSQLWGNCIVSRLELEENSRVGDFALVGTGDPVRDPFLVQAHKFSVFIPASRLQSESIERLARHLIETEKPAHTQFELVKIEPRFRVGMQATVGLDTQVGAYPMMVLNHCATLNYDALLSCESTRIPGWPPKTRAGCDSSWQSCVAPDSTTKRRGKTSARSETEPGVECRPSVPSGGVIAPKTFQVGERSRIGVSSLIG
jgi:phage tail-like protein